MSRFCSKYPECGCKEVGMMCKEPEGAQRQYTAASCDTSYQPRDYNAESIMGEITQLPPEKLKAIQDYTKRLRKKHPHMKPMRLQRKVAEHFKIKLT